MSTINGEAQSSLEKVYHLLNEELGWSGRMIAGSKSQYTRDNPDGYPVFNCNIVVDGTKIWYGDVDVVIDQHSLRSVAKEAGATLHLLREMDGRFEHETSPLVHRAVAVIEPDGKLYIDPNFYLARPEICEKNNFLEKRVG